MCMKCVISPSDAIDLESPLCPTHSHKKRKARNMNRSFPPHRCQCVVSQFNTRVFENMQSHTKMENGTTEETNRRLNSPLAIVCLLQEQESMPMPTFPRRRYLSNKTLQTLTTTARRKKIKDLKPGRGGRLVPTLRNTKSRDELAALRMTVIQYFLNTQGTEIPYLFDCKPWLKSFFSSFRAAYILYFFTLSKGIDDV